MIAFLRGRLVARETGSVILDVAGVGYRLYISNQTAQQLPAAGQEVEMHTYLQVREDALQLFGFAGREEHDLFRILIGVVGVGPKLALSLLSALNPAEVRRAVTFQDVSRLTGIPGIGKKTAARLLLELRDKLGATGASGAETGEAAGDVPPDAVSEARAALVGLGYSGAEAEEAIRAAGPELSESAVVEDIVRLALRRLAGRQAARDARKR